MELLIWLAIIVFSILRSIQQSNKKKAGQGTPDQVSSPPPDGVVTDPFQEAIREIEAALRGTRAEEDVQSASKTETVFSEPEIKRPSVATPERRHEPEFHSMERPISENRYESDTAFTESYSNKTLESSATYEDAFPESTYYDTNFSHAHPDEEEQSMMVESPRVTSSPHSISIKARLKDKQEIAEAIILQEILNEPAFKRRRR